MRILFLGDIVGRPARQQVISDLAGLREEFAVDFVIINVENAAGGFGVTPQIADDVLAAGADVLTTGNHVWDRKEIIQYIINQPKLLRPYNMAAETPGKGHVIVENQTGVRLAVANFMANLFMGKTDFVFERLDHFLGEVRLGHEADAIFIDLHGEATSEKMAIGFYLDGRVSTVVGTHTHVPTADHHIMPKGTAYQTDAGMCGNFTSVIGMRPELAVERFFNNDKGQLEVAKGEPTLCGTIVDIDDSTGLATAITPFRRGGVLAET